MDLVKKTAELSLAIQLLSGLISFNSYTIKVKEDHQILKEILYFENIVQTIEFIFYIWLKNKLKLSIALKTLSISRYYDWFFTTPTMLFSTIVFLNYQEKVENNTLKKFTIKEFYQNNSNDVKFITITNFLMLLSGYLGETNVISKDKSLIFGFIFFILSFKRIYKYAEKSILGKKLYKILLIIWGLYGFAYLLSEEYKNISYNILDLFAKNFFGVYISLKIKENQLIK